VSRRPLAELQLAVMLLSRLPAGRLGDPVPAITAARWAFPLVGLPLGLALWGVLALAPAGLAGAALALGLGALLTGGLHHDGLADFADGMGGQSVAQRLEIMRDSRIGSYGVIALLFTGLAGAGALATLDAAAGGASELCAAVLFVAVFSRLLMLGALDLLPPARAEGLGAQAAGRRGVAPAWLPGLALGTALALAAGPATAVAALAMVGVAAVLGWQARRRLGGQTGDVLGAVQLASETAGWVTLAALA
jgi:adenosylcobinamide-GDP ribazoletransferase